VAVKSEVIVRVQWADPERSGLRTLRFHARSLDQACKAIAQGVGGSVVEDAAATGDEPPLPRPSPRLRAAKRDRTEAAARLPPAPDAPTAAAKAFVEGTVEWVGEVPAGRLLPPMTLVEARAGQRKVILRLGGTHEFDVGTRVYLSGLNGDAQTLFDAELVSGAGKPPFFFEVRAWAV